jgi:O-antigen ligase
MTLDRNRLMIAVSAFGGVAILYLLYSRPGLFSNTTYLGGLMLLQIIAWGLWHYEKAFLPLMLGSFMLAGINTPFLSIGLTLRWIFLAVGAFAGFLLWLNRRRPFSTFHWVAIASVLAALASSRVAAVPQVALLKSLSLFLLFLYGVSGARLAISGHEASFTRGLLLTCEWTVYITAASYFLFGYPLFGNPNSLGAVMGVVAVPVLLWGAIACSSRVLRQRMAFACLLSAALLFYSLSRAGIAAGLVSSLLITCAFRRQRLAVRAGLFLVLIAALVGVLEPGAFDRLTSEVGNNVLYKGKREQGLFGSRLTPWQQTVDIIQERPWFGSGFGSEVGVSTPHSLSLTYTQEEAGREHGSSYLTLVQWVGLLGLVPFALLLFLLLRRIVQVCLWMWRNASAAHPAVPLALVMAGGLVNTIFEDWLFAVGYYLTVLFWAFAFGLVDLAPQTAGVREPYLRPRHPAPHPAAFAARQ